MSWDEKDWAYTYISGKIANVDNAIKALEKKRILYGIENERETSGDNCSVQFYAYSKNVDNLDSNEITQYNETAHLYDVRISYQYLDYLTLNFPRD